MFFIFVFCVFEVFFQSVFLGRPVCSSGELSQLATDRPFYGRDQHRPHLLFYLITKLYKEYPCIFVIQFMLDNVEAFFAGDQPQQHCVTHFFFLKNTIVVYFRGTFYRP